MEQFIFNAIDKYFRTITATGSFNKNEKLRLFMTVSLYKIYIAFCLFRDPDTQEKFINKEVVEKFNKVLDCLCSNNCLFSKDVPYFTTVVPSEDSLVTFINEDIISTFSGNTMVAFNRNTQNFKDFIIPTEIQADNYVVGYDNSSNTELAINVNDLGVFWGVDI